MYNPFSLILASLRALIVFFSLVIFLLPYILYEKIFGSTEAQAFKLRRTWVTFIQFILGISKEVKGAPIEETALYVCNHRSFADPVILANVVDTFVLAKAEVSKIPLLGKGAELTGVIYVERSNNKSRSAVRKTMVKALLQGKNVMLYPEGTTNGELNVMPYKKGSFIEAANNDIPVIPMVLEYKEQKDLWHNTGMMTHHFKQFGKLRTKVKIIIGPAMYGDNGEVLKTQVENWTNENIKEIHSEWDSYFNSVLT